MGVLRRLSRSSPLRRLWSAAKNVGVETLLWLALRLVGRLSLERALRLGDVVGAAAYRILAGPRQRARQNLQRAFGGALTAGACERLARASFINAARYFCELAKIEEIHARRAEYIEYEGIDIRAAAGGDGCIVVTGQVGNWELLAAALAWLDVPVAVVARRVYAERLNHVLVDFRKRQRVQTIAREMPSSASRLHGVLESKGIAAMLIDPDGRRTTASVPFFGTLARTPLAAASLAVRRQLPVYMAFIQRRGDAGWRIVVKPPLTLPRGADHRAAVGELTQQFIAGLEAQVRANPAEWVWWHRRRPRQSSIRLDLESGFPYRSETAA